MRSDRRIQRRYSPPHPARERIPLRSGNHRRAADDDRSDLPRYLDILSRRKGLAVTIFLVVVVGVLVGTVLQEPVYRATGLLEIRHRGGGAPAGELLAGDNVTETSLRTQYELLRSAALSRRVIRDLELHRLQAFRPGSDDAGGGADGIATTAPGAGDAGPASASVAPTPSVSAVALQSAVRSFQSKLTVDPKVDSRLVEVSFDFEDPEVAARVTNAVLESYVEMRAGSGRDAAGWLDSQMDSVRADLEASEARLQEYARAHGLPYMVDEDVSQQIRERVRRLEDELAAAEARRYEKESLFNLVVRQGTFDAVDDRVVEELSIRLADLRREYASVSSTFTDDYPRARELRRELQQVEALLEQEKERIGRKIQNDYEVAVRGEEMLRQALEDEQAAADALAERSGAYHLLRREVLANRELYAGLQQTQKQVRVSAALEATGVAIVDRAVPPDQPHRPLVRYNMALAMMTGLVLGIGGAFLREYFDDTVRTEQEVGRAVDVPVLAMIPTFHEPLNGSRPLGIRGRRMLPGGPNDSRSGPDAWIRIDGDGSEHGYQAIVEAFSSLRTAMLFKSDGVPPRSILVSSCQPGDGKTTVSLNFALSLSRLDLSVLLVDGDLRRPTLHRALGVPRAPGLADHLADGLEWQAQVHEDEGTGLHVLPSGRPLANPGDLLSGTRTESLIRVAEEAYDFVVLDAPALFVNVPDARLLAQMVAGVVVVVRSGTTPRPLLGRILEAAPNVLGVVVNDLNPKRLPSYYREYTSTPDDEGDGGWRT